ncbi:hypothetical protein [Paenibacillus donghaensis]|uniref:GIY-YIG domain-containing protein n=1 Tax=Paenibacillus donghaensis TaxID=414771 RepID=A0A2Z2KLJ7_9BACL|nr:hypothetical protein [Paenibacillus donghaensis]ASA21942.1 hypothetical protein B9T62_14855 [Paenibacillus donghaensis]
MKIEYSEADLLNLTDDFLAEFKTSFMVSNRKESLGNIRMDNVFLNSLKTETGIYYFLQDDKVKYVGRALPSVGLRSRIINQITAFGDLKWDAVIHDSNVVIGVIIIKKEYWYFISALEHYLIEKLGNPEFNKRC